MLGTWAKHSGGSRGGWGGCIPPPASDTGAAEDVSMRKMANFSALRADYYQPVIIPGMRWGNPQSFQIPPKFFWKTAPVPHNNLIVVCATVLLTAIIHYAVIVSCALYSYVTVRFSKHAAAAATVFACCCHCHTIGLRLGLLVLRIQ